MNKKELVNISEYAYDKDTELYEDIENNIFYIKDGEYIETDIYIVENYDENTTFEEFTFYSYHNKNTDKYLTIYDYEYFTEYKNQIRIVNKEYSITINYIDDLFLITYSHENIEYDTDLKINKQILNVLEYIFNPIEHVDNYVNVYHKYNNIYQYDKISYYLYNNKIDVPFRYIINKYNPLNPLEFVITVFVHKKDIQLYKEFYNKYKY